MRPRIWWNLGESDSTLCPCEGQTPPWYMRPHQSHPKCQSAARLHEPSVSGSGGIRIRDLLHAMQALFQNWATNPYCRLNKKTRLLFRCNLVPYQLNLKGILPVQRPQFLGATEITFCGGKTNRAIIQVWQLLFHGKIFSYDIMFIWMLEIKWWIFKGKMQLLCKKKFTLYFAVPVEILARI